MLTEVHRLTNAFKPFRNRSISPRQSHYKRYISSFSPWPKFPHFTKTQSTWITNDKRVSKKRRKKKRDG